MQQVGWLVQQADERLELVLLQLVGQKLGHRVLPQHRTRAGQSLRQRACETIASTQSCPGIDPWWACQLELSGRVLQKAEQNSKKLGVRLVTEMTKCSPVYKACGQIQDVTDKARVMQHTCIQNCEGTAPKLVAPRTEPSKTMKVLRGWHESKPGSNLPCQLRFSWRHFEEVWSLQCTHAQA